MSATSDELRDTVRFGSSRRLSMQMIPFALGIIALGVVLLWLELSQPYPESTAMAWLILAGGLAFLIIALVSHARKETHSLVISPFGVLYDHAAKHVIPWSEITSIGRMDATHGTGKSRTRARNAVYLTIGESYYRARIFEDTFFNKVFGSDFFLNKGDDIRIPVFHPLISEKADDIWAAVEPRWRAFSEHAKGSPDNLINESEASLTFQSLAHEAGRAMRTLLPKGKNRFGRDQ